MGCMTSSHPLRAPSEGPVGAQTLLNGMAVLEAIDQGARDLAGVQEVVRLPRSTVHRLIQALRSRGFVRDTREGLALGPALIELGFHSLHANPITEVARPVLESLAAETHDTVHLGVEDQASVLYLDKIPGTRGAEMRSRIGYRMPLAVTGIGKALLLDAPDRWEACWQEGRDAAGIPLNAESQQRFLTAMEYYRARGYTFDLEENEPGIRCVAAPVRDGSGALVGAISVAATSPYMARERMDLLVPMVRAAAASISNEMGYHSR